MIELYKIYFIIFMVFLEFYLDIITDTCINNNKKKNILLLKQLSYFLDGFLILNICYIYIYLQYY